MIPEEKHFFIGNTQNAFRDKSNKELSRAWLLFFIMNNPFIVKIATRILVVCLKLHIPVNYLIKKTIFNHFCGGENINECNKIIDRLKKSSIGTILDYATEGNKEDADFEQTKVELIKVIHLAKTNTNIPFVSLKITAIANAVLLEKANKKIKLTAKETQEYIQIEERLNAICKEAHQNNTPIYIDAEESWIQAAIDALAERMMLLYNTQRPIVLTTLQMYRIDRLYYLNKLLIDAKTKNYFLGVKLVRGAYQEKENEKAISEKYNNPIHATKFETDRDFNAAIDLCLKNINKVLLCAGTHNEESTLHLAEKMKELGIANNHKHIYFSQLYGMSDHISYNLAKEGYNVAKYLPYGPIKSVIPYLVRRAEENTSIAGQSGRELRLILEERERRKTIVKQIQNH